MDDAAAHCRSNESPLDGDVIGQLAQLLLQAQPWPTALPPRGMLRRDAARYCGITPRVFSYRVKAKELPEPTFGKGRGAIWDRHEIDAALDRRMSNRSARAATDAAHDLIRRSKDFFKHDK